MAKVELNNQSSEPEEASKRKIKQQSQRLHPLKYNILNNPFFKYSDEKNTIGNVKKLVNLELMLTVISIALMILLIALIVRLPSLPASGPAVAPTTLPETGEGTPTPSTGGVTVDGKVYRDNRDLTDGESNNGGSGSQTPTKLYANTELGFTVRYPETWTVEEPVINGVKTTKISLKGATFDTYIQFTNQKPNPADFASTGTENKRDIYTATTIYRAEGYVKFGRATWAYFPVIPDKFYVIYAGDVEKEILPILDTFST